MGNCCSTNKDFKPEKRYTSSEIFQAIKPAEYHVWSTLLWGCVHYENQSQAPNNSARVQYVRAHYEMVTRSSKISYLSVNSPEFTTILESCTSIEIHVIYDLLSALVDAQFKYFCKK